MEFKDIVKIDGMPSARVEQTTPKAICLRFDGKHSTEWLPLSKLEVVSEKTIVQSGKNDQVEYICKLPEWLKDKIYIPEEEELEYCEQCGEDLPKEHTCYTCCGNEITGEIEDIGLCPTCKEHI